MRFFNPYKLWRSIMHIETQVKAILDLVTALTASQAALTQAVTALSTAVAAIPAQTGSAPDLTALSQAVADIAKTTDTIATGVIALQQDVEVDENAATGSAA
jgi:hypothetical protein